MTAAPSRADEGRRLLAEWKSAHYPHRFHTALGYETGCRRCTGLEIVPMPCPTARLIAAVELAEAAHGEHCIAIIKQRGCDREDVILAALAGDER